MLDTKQKVSSLLSQKRYKQAALIAYQESCKDKQAVLMYRNTLKGFKTIDDLFNYQESLEFVFPYYIVTCGFPDYNNNRFYLVESLSEARALQPIYIFSPGL